MSSLGARRGDPRSKLTPSTGGEVKSPTKQTSGYGRLFSMYELARVGGT